MGEQQLQQLELQLTTEDVLVCRGAARHVVGASPAAAQGAGPAAEQAEQAPGAAAWALGRLAGSLGYVPNTAVRPQAGYGAVSGSSRLQAAQLSAPGQPAGSALRLAGAAPHCSAAACACLLSCAARRGPLQGDAVLPALSEADMRELYEALSFKPDQQMASKGRKAAPAVKVGARAP